MTGFENESGLLLKLLIIGLVSLKCLIVKAIRRFCPLRFVSMKYRLFHLISAQFSTQTRKSSKVSSVLGFNAFFPGEKMELLRNDR
jgi:hypothetical protein